MSERLFLRGTLILTVTGLCSRLMGFFYRIFLSQAIGAQSMGIYQLAMPVQGILMACTSIGIQAAIYRVCASYTALGKEKEARDCFFLGVSLSVLASVFLSFFLYQKAAFLSEQILKEPRTFPLLRILSFSFPLSALHSCINSFFYSKKKTGLPAAILLLEQITRIGATYVLYLIFLSEKREITASIAAGGALFGELVACCVSLFTLGMDFSKAHYHIFKISQKRLLFREIQKIAVPHSLNRLLLTLLSGMEMVLIPQRLQLTGISASQALGIYGVFTGMALPLLLFPATVPNSLSVMLMPSVAGMQALGSNERIRTIASRTCTACFLFGGFFSAFFFLLGNPLGHFLFHSETAGSYIRGLAFICPFLYANTTLESILSGLGKTDSCLFHNVAGVCTRIAFVLFAIPRFGMHGYFHGILLSQLLLCFLHLRVLGSMIKKT